MTTDTSCSCPLKSLLQFIGLATMTLVAIVAGGFCSALGPMYLGWLIGTPMICLCAVAGAVYLDEQERTAPLNGGDN